MGVKYFRVLDGERNSKIVAQFDDNAIRLTKKEENIFTRSMLTLLTIHKGSLFNKVVDTFEGTATCSPEDIFVEEVGKDLAIRRADFKYAKARKSIMVTSLNRIIDSLTEVRDYELIRYEKAKTRLLDAESVLSGETGNEEKKVGLDP